jgi:N-acetylmuramoyl-L-alanine amidase
VDVGHYYGAPGATAASGKAELEFNQELAYEVRHALEIRGFDVRLIEEQPVLQERTRAALGADLFVSLHHDAVRPELLADAELYSGFSLFVSRLNPAIEKSVACASAIGERLRAIGLAPSRYHADPVLGENRPYADEKNGVHFFDNLTVARTASMPAVLVEAGVIVNRREEAMLRDSATRQRIAGAVAQGVRDCLP